MANSGYKFYTSGAPQQPDESKLKYNIRKLFTVKTLNSIKHDEDEGGLKKALTAFDLIMIGIGGIIGAGIFVLTGKVAATNAGPAVIISYIIAGITATFAALSYSELSSMIPVAGSAYTYTYATLGELVAWIIGWDLMLEYLVASAAVSVSWSGYFVDFFANTFDIHFATSWTTAPISVNSDTGAIERIPGSIFNVPAFGIAVIIMILLIIGVKESATVNSIIVSVKLFVIVIFVIAGSTKINHENYDPFVPPNEGKFSEYGASGIFAASSIVFFAYIGFDAVSTTSQEAKNPKRDLPIGILGSLGICTVLYIAVCVVLTGVVPYKELDSPAPIAVAVKRMQMKWLGVIVDIGAMAGLTTVILVSMIGQSRIFLSMAQDGLFFPAISKVHPRFKTPYVATAITGIFSAITASLLPMAVLSELTSVGTLLAFFLVNIGVMILRLKAPDAPRAFKVPGGPYFVPIVGAILSILLLATAGRANRASIERLFSWMAIGLVVYAFYGRRRSKANNRGLDVERVIEKI